MTFRDLLDQREPRVEIDGEKLQDYRGVSVYEAGNYCKFVIGDCIFATRPALSHVMHEVRLIVQRVIIDNIMDGHVPVSERIFQHLIQHGFKPKCYKNQDRFIARQEKEFSR